MRIIAGSARRTILVSPEGLKTRPTTDRIKETLFNMLQLDIIQADFLDLYAGSGAIGLEALSRGAKSCVLVESDDEANKCIVTNLNKAKLADNATVIKGDVLCSMNRILNINKQFDIIFMDPPYEANLEEKTISKLVEFNVMKDTTILIVEALSTTKFDFLKQYDLEIYKYKKYGKNAHVFIKKTEG